MSATHGMSKSPEYATWTQMNSRCHNPRAHNFADYGGRGITVCDEWRGSGGFERFFAHMGPRPGRGYSIDRIDNARGYEPGNVRWATARQQARNTRRSRLIPLGGELLTYEEAGARLGISKQAIHQRVAWGWTAVEAATYPRGTKPERFAGRRGGLMGAA